MSSDMFGTKALPDQKITGVAAGIVTDNKDPENMGRVKVMVSRISGEDESNWARVCSFMAGNDRGGFFLPEIDDEVLVAFENGNVDCPYVIGCLWNGKDALPKENSDDDIRLIKSRSGHLIILDDTDGAEKIEIKDGSGETMIAFETSDKKITIESGQDIEISASNGKVTIDAKEIEIKSSDAMKIEAGSDLDLKGETVNIN